jgi:hypothetical protein
MPRDCPKCDEALTRARRKSWMHYIPDSKYYVCRGCSLAYLLIFNRWLLRWKRHPQNKSSSKKS